MATKSLTQLRKDWAAAIADMERVAARIPDITGLVAVAVCKDNFRLQAYDDGNSRQKWQKRDPKTNRRYDLRKGVKGTVYNSASKILDQSGDLQDAITHKRTDATNVFIGVDLTIIPYAAIHNEGLTGSAWGKHPFKMPKRQYMPLIGEGANKKILTAAQKKVAFEMGKALRNFKLTTT